MRWAALASMLLLATGVCGCRRPAAPARTAATRPPPYNSPLPGAAYPWPRGGAEYLPLPGQVAPPPAGFRRVEAKDRSWEQWLRNLPVCRQGTPVAYQDGATAVPAGHPNLAAVVDLDLRKNQECSDTIQRLRAEYLRWVGRENDIVFSTGDGDLSWPEWKRGVRPHYDGHHLSFAKSGQPGNSRTGFDRYLAAVFAWCGTDSLKADGKPVRPSDIRIGDFLVHGGKPGHCVLIADLARDAAGHIRALILHGYKPAQSAHVLAPDSGGPWFDLDPRKPVTTPFWGEFQWSELRRFRTEP